MQLLLHWLHEQMPRCMMVAFVARVNLEMLWKKCDAKFAGDTQNKRVAVSETSK